MAALSANTAIAIMKFIVAAFSGSASLFSEGIHSSADTLNQVVLLVGKHKSMKLPDDKHPFGYARIVFFASFCVAILLFFVGGAYSLMEAIEKIEHVVHNTGGHTLDMQALIVAAVILAIAIVLEALSLHTAFKEVREEQEREGTTGTGLIKFYKETHNSSLIVIVTEDTTAIVGLGLALAGVLATLATGDPLWDAIGGAAVGVLLIIAAFILGREIASLIIGESLPAEKIRKIEELVEAHPTTAACRQVKTSAIGTSSVLVEIDVAYAPDGSVTAADVIRSIEEIKAGVKALWADENIYVSTCVEPVNIESTEAPD
jgi:cation diffusion facilitator family transporter